MKYERKPEYIESQHGQFRIVSRPNGQWVPQRRVALRGFNADFARPHQDCWEDLHSPSTREVAKATAELWAKGGSGYQDVMAKAIQQ